MTKILMRGNCSPLSNPTIADLIRDNTIGSNSGNMLFQASVVRALMKKNTDIDFLNTRNEGFRPQELEQLKGKYDYFVIPLANAFRKNFLAELTHLRIMVEALNIPCAVVGVGMQANLDGTFAANEEVDEEAKRFIGAVLNHSSTIGIRGECTAKYMRKLGFHEGRHFEIIGCPAMFSLGDNLPEPKETDLTPESRINFNRRLKLPSSTHHLIERLLEPFEDYWFVPQNYEDYQLLYVGKKDRRAVEGTDYGTYPITQDAPIFKENRVRGFLNVPTWLDFMKKGDFTFGTRIHGNIISVLAGVPTYIFAPDMRVVELADYHDIPHCTIRDGENVKDLFQLYEATDFSKTKKGHHERFLHYVDFLNENGLPHIWDGTEKYFLGKTPYDWKVFRTKFQPPVESYLSHTAEERKQIDADYKKARQERKANTAARRAMDARSDFGEQGNSEEQE